MLMIIIINQLARMGQAASAILPLLGTAILQLYKVDVKVNKLFINMISKKKYVLALI